MRGLVAVAASLLLVAACGGTLPSALPSLEITHPIASAPSEAPSEEATEEAQPTKTPKVSAEPTEQTTEEPTEEATPEETPKETELASEEPTPGQGGHTITVFAGGGGQAVAPSVLAVDAALQRPTGVSIGSPDSPPHPITFIVDSNLGIAFSVENGTISEVIAGLLGPQGVSAEPDVNFGDSNLWVADTANSRIVTPNGSGNWQTIAGSSIGQVGFKGDGGPAKRSLLSQPFDVAGPYIADTTNHRVRAIDPKGDIRTIAGNGTQGYGGDNGPATSAELSSPQAIAVGGADVSKLFIADYGNFRIREVDLASDKITTVAGTGDGTAVAYDSKLTGTETPVQRASAIAADNAGNVYFPVFWGDRGTTIMQLAPDGTMTLVAGGGQSTTPGVDATDFVLPDVLGLAINPYDGSLLICGSDGKVYSVAGVASTL
ncbi:MAG TPA: hypothetical protein VH371_01740 [Candidatus Limnocylindrales bacterium]|jgi:hypothetical protein